jgi:Tfp pilus assembly PilM family ATPase
MADWKLMPLGIDLGTTRARIAVVERDRGADVRIRAIATRDLPDGAVTPFEIDEPALVAAVLEEMLAEIGVRERRCVLALGTPTAMLRTLRFPPMSWAERAQAARFEAQRFAGWNVDEVPSVVRVHPVDREAGIFAVGVARQAAITARIDLTKHAGLRAVAVEHDALALRRTFADCDAIVDIGAERSSIHVFGAGSPHSIAVQTGGAAITRGIAMELSIDLPTAERRKRILGCAGAGTAAREEVVAALAAVVERARGRSTIERIAITGNGARLPSLAREIEEATGAITEMPVPELLRSDAYPEDVVRAAAPDWSLAASLAAWCVAT